MFALLKKARLVDSLRSVLYVFLKKARFVDNLRALYFPVLRKSVESVIAFVCLLLRDRRTQWPCESVYSFVNAGSGLHEADVTEALIDTILTNSSVCSSVGYPFETI